MGKRTCLRIVPQPSPSAALHPHAKRRHLLLHRVDASEPRRDGIRQGAARRERAAPTRAQILPEECVIQMSAAVEFQRPLQTDDRRHVPRGDGTVELLEGDVEIRDVRVVVLRVVDLHRLGGYDGGQGGVVVGEVGQRDLAPPGGGRQVRRGRLG